MLWCLWLSPHWFGYLLTEHMHNLRAPVTLHTLHFTTLYTPHSTLYTSHSLLYTPHSTLYTLHFTLHTPHSTLSTPHCRLVTGESLQKSVLRDCISMCFHICTINMRVSIRVRGLHLVFIIFTPVKVCGVVSQGSGSASYWVNTFQAGPI